MFFFLRHDVYLQNFTMKRPRPNFSAIGLFATGTEAPCRGDRERLGQTRSQKAGSNRSSRYQLADLLTSYKPLWMMPDCLIATNEMANFQEMMFSIQRIVKKQLNTRLRKFAPWHFWSFTPWSNSAVIEQTKNMTTSMWYVGLYLFSRRRLLLHAMLYDVVCISDSLPCIHQSISKWSTGWWLSHSFEKYESKWESFPIFGVKTIKNVWNCHLGIKVIWLIFL